MSNLRPWSPLIVPPRLDGRVLEHMLQLLLALNVDYLIEVPQTPPLYEANIRYVPEPPGQEQWLSIPFVRLRGHTVCHSLACWRAAELRVKGEDAVPVWSERTRADGSRLYHVQVRRQPTMRHPQGRIEDPSAMLGMNMTPEQLRRLGPTHHVEPIPGQEMHQVAGLTPPAALQQLRRFMGR